MKIPTEVQTLIDTLGWKTENPMQPAGCWFSKIFEFLEVVSKSSEVGYKNCSPINNEFKTETFVSQTVRPFLEELIVSKSSEVVYKNRSPMNNEFKT